MKQEMEEQVQKCKAAVQAIKGKLPAFVDLYFKELPSQTPFRVVCLRDILIHRVTHLAEEGLDLHSRKSVIPFILVVRAAMETAALLYMLDKKVETAIETSKGDELEEFLRKATIGSRNNDTEVTSINTITALDHLSKKYPHIKKFYDDLSEFCHPNFAGVLASYSRLSDDKLKFILGPDPDPPVDFGIVPLSETLLVTGQYYDSVRKREKKLFSLFCGD